MAPTQDEFESWGRMAFRKYQVRSQSGASVLSYISRQDAKSTDIKIYFDDKKNIPQRSHALTE